MLTMTTDEARAAMAEFERWVNGPCQKGRPIPEDVSDVLRMAFRTGWVAGRNWERRQQAEMRAADRRSIGP